MIPADFEAQLKAALSLELDYEDRILHLPPEAVKSQVIPASVLLLLGYSQIPVALSHTFKGSARRLPSLLYTRRTEEVETHKGQISFPGGHTEPEELAQPEITALRETEEEVGISRDHVKLIGKLPDIFTATGYLIRPYVSVLICSIETISLTLNPQETAEAIWAPLDGLLSPGIYQAETFHVGNLNYPIDVYQYQNHRIWGATGSITKNFLDRLDKVGTFIS